MNTVKNKIIKKKYFLTVQLNTHDFSHQNPCVRNLKKYNKNVVKQIPPYEVKESEKKFLDLYLSVS